MTKMLIFLFSGALTITGCSKNESPMASGTTGKLTWSLCEDGTLTISGKGEMPDYFYNYPYDTHSSPPWQEYRDNITSVIIGNDINKIGDMVFYQCGKITSISIGNSVTVIGRVAFQECESLTSVDIPNSVASIKPYAFHFCTALSSVTIGNSVNDIGNHAFSGCFALSKIVSYQEIPPKTIPNSISLERSISSGTFFDVNYTICTLLVLSGSVEAYKAAEVWNDFVNIKAIQ